MSSRHPRPLPQRLAAFAAATLLSLGILGAEFRNPLAAAAHSPAVAAAVGRALGAPEVAWVRVEPTEAVVLADAAAAVQAAELARASATVERASAAAARRSAAAALRSAERAGRQREIALRATRCCPRSAGHAFARELPLPPAALVAAITGDSGSFAVRLVPARSLRIEGSASPRG